ncbi:MAG: FAD-binding oxidoreductase [Candidatus Nanohaloarchaea archaeon]|nr:FAD-binding oxidoreductase [Candidatus Nanohaloarchaea archaeon]
MRELSLPLSMVSHERRVQEISDRMEDFYENGVKPRITHNATHSTRPGEMEHGDDVINVGHLNEFLEIDEEQGKIVMEPDIRMDELVAKTLEHGFIPKVVPECPGITVGGAIQGGAAESSAFKYGLVHETCEEYELVLGDGSIVRASGDENEDLFAGTACSYGTLGILTKVKMDLIPAKEYVRLTYHRVDSWQEAVEQFKQRMDDDVDFIDAILFSEELGVVMTGELTEDVQEPVQTFTNLTDEYFYIHAKDRAQAHEEVTETIPIQDYFFRYDRGGFWAVDMMCDYFHIPNIRIMRLLLSPFLNTANIYRAAHAGNVTTKFFVQDIAVPNGLIDEVMNWEQEDPEIYPLWLCPGKPSDGDDRLSPAYQDCDFGINVGMYGIPKEDHMAANKALERLTVEKGGRIALYAHQHYSEEDFWTVYDKEWYTNLREKYNAEQAFEDVYERTYTDPETVGAPSFLSALVEFFKPPERLKIIK